MPTANSIAIEKIFPAPIEQVWKAWTKPTLILNWFGSDPNGTGIFARIDLRPGGDYEISFKDSDQTEHVCMGTYLDVQALFFLKFTWTWKSEPNVESIVSVALSPQGDHTRMQFEHAQIGTESKHDYFMGWQSTFSKLEQMLRTV